MCELDVITKAYVHACRLALIHTRAHEHRDTDPHPCKSNTHQDPFFSSSSVFPGPFRIPRTVSLPAYSQSSIFPHHAGLDLVYAPYPTIVRVYPSVLPLNTTSKLRVDLNMSRLAPLQLKRLLSKETKCRLEQCFVHRFVEPFVILVRWICPDKCGMQCNNRTSMICMTKFHVTFPGCDTGAQAFTTASARESTRPRPALQRRRRKCAA